MGSGSLDQIARKVVVIVCVKGLLSVFLLRRKHGRLFISVAMSVHFRALKIESVFQEVLSRDCQFRSLSDQLDHISNRIVGGAYKWSFAANVVIEDIVLGRVSGDKAKEVKTFEPLFLPAFRV